MSSAVEGKADVTGGGITSVMELVEDLLGDTHRSKREDDATRPLHPFDNLEKAAVLQEARIFHDSILVRENPQKCCRIIAQLLRLKDQKNGNAFSQEEATEIFFGGTKLFVSSEASVRRLLYLFFKEIYVFCDPSDVIIITSCLTKDMSCDVNLYRANALRVLRHIIDAAMLGAIERYVKQAIIDSSPQVASAALVSATHLFHRSQEFASITKKWIGEAQQAISQPYPMVQFHGIMFLYLIRSHDRLAVSKLVAQYTARKPLASPLAQVLLIRFTANLMRDEVKSGRTVAGSIQHASTVCREGYIFLASRLTEQRDMVAFEAASAICQLPATQPEDLVPAVGVLQRFLSSPKPTVRSGATRILAMVAEIHPRIVAKCIPELEALINDSNVLVATVSACVLLKTANDESLEHVLAVVSPFLDAMGDEYRISVVRSIQQLCLLYPAKHHILLGFLGKLLRGEGGLEFKRSIVAGIAKLMSTVPDTAESALLHLCEFVEDSEYARLTTEILYVVGTYGPKTPSPSRFIPYIYNRILLERPVVRAASVSALCRFASLCPALRSSILLLIRRSLLDEDNEVRDRAALAVAILKDPETKAVEEAVSDPIAADSDKAAYLLSPLPMSFDKLAKSIQRYAVDPEAMSTNEPITFAELPAVDEPAVIHEAAPFADSRVEDELVTHPKDPAHALYEIPEFASLGRVFSSSKPVDLTESETEYFVRCIKHVYTDHVVVQFMVENTIEGQRIDTVRVAIEPSDEALYEVIGEVCADAIGYREVKSCFSLLKRNVDLPITPCTMSCELRFSSTRIDQETGVLLGESTEEEYALEDLEISTSDYVAKLAVLDFRSAWETMTAQNEAQAKYGLQYKSIETAVTALLAFIGMEACDGTGKVNPGSPKHMLHLSGIFVGGMTVLARAQISLHKETSGVMLRVAVRSGDVLVSQMVLDSIK